MNAIEVIKTRRSVRAYQDKPVDRAVIEDIVDCGRLAATARNTQPWEFIVVTDPATRGQLADLAPNGPFLVGAPVCIVVLCKDGTYYLEDGCAATQNMLLAAHAHGLGSCWVAGDKKPYMSAVLEAIKAPKGYRLVSLIAIGYATERGVPSKRALADVIHWEHF